MHAIWKTYLTEADRALYAVTGYGAPGRPPRNPALLVIDMTFDFCGPEGATSIEAARTVRTACGPVAWAAMPHIARLAGAARVGGRPVVYTRRSAARLAAVRSKNARGVEDRAEGNEIMSPLAPASSDTVMDKSKPSAFWRTGLDDLLAERQCDGVILTGCTTSGCVRATALDAFNRDLPCTIVPEAVFDRFEASHAIGLFDLQAKYADLASTAVAEGMLAGCQAPPSNSHPR